ncbi:MAG: ComEA family DNA-binding protein [Candidatus Omnitrophica bacterium]|nr:ComEA family DNA-binding protein [Candidatus Omnitrophota bacterium]
MIPLTYRERKILLLIGVLLLLGGILRLSKISYPSFEEEKPIPLKKININTATLEELTTLPYIGEKIALRIINHRKLQGEFKSLEDLLKIKGIGHKKLELIKDYVIF